MGCEACEYIFWRHAPIHSSVNTMKKKMHAFPYHLPLKPPSSIFPSFPSSFSPLPSPLSPFSLAIPSPSPLPYLLLFSHSLPSLSALPFSTLPNLASPTHLPFSPFPFSIYLSRYRGVKVEPLHIHSFLYRSFTLWCIRNTPKCCLFGVTQGRWHPKWTCKCYHSLITSGHTSVVFSGSHRGVGIQSGPVNVIILWSPLDTPVLSFRSHTGALASKVDL